MKITCLTSLVTSIGCLSMPAFAQCVVGEVYSVDAPGGSFYGGLATAIDGDTMLAGAVGVEAVYAYRFDGTTWAHQQTLTASDGEPGDKFGGTGLSVSCDVAIIAARADDGVGAAYVFRRTNGQWTEEQKLSAPKPEADDEFGMRVSIRGDVALVGASEFANGGSGSAYVYRFDYADAIWKFEQEFAPPGLLPGDTFGYPIALSPCGSVAIVGAPYDDEGGNLAGAAYVFRFNGAAWVLDQKLTASDANESEFFGISAAIDHDRVAIGAFAPGGTGSAYVFEFDRSTMTWQEQPKLAPAELQAGDWFGWNLSLSGDALAVLSVHDDDAAEDAGAIYIYRRNAGSWDQQSKLTVSNPVTGHLFGGGMWLDGDTLAIGAPGDDDAGDDTGAVYVFAGVGGIDHDGNGVADVCEALCPADTTGDGLIDFEDLLRLLSEWGPCP